MVAYNGPARARDLAKRLLNAPDVLGWGAPEVAGWREPERACMVGRFQPPHKGHLKAMLDILAEFEELVIVIGSAQLSHELDNPFTVGERMVMLRLALSEAGVPPERYWLVPVPDAPMHVAWVPIVLSYSPRFKVVFSNEPLTRRLFEEAGFEVRPIPFYRREIYSATEVRRRMLAGEEWRELVPPAVARYIEAIGGVERLRALARTDKPARAGSQEASREQNL